MMMNTCIFFNMIIFGDNSINDQMVTPICRKRKKLRLFFPFCNEKIKFLTKKH